VRWVKDEYIELEANPGWWGGAPRIKRLVFRPIPEPAVRVAALQAGEVDIDKHPRLYVSKAPSVRPIFIPIYTSPLRHHPRFSRENRPSRAKKLTVG
jgi:ABC-type transport system substrate-binding protein